MITKERGVKKFIWELALEAMYFYNRPVKVKEVTKYIKSILPEYKSSNTSPSLNMLSVNSMGRVHHNACLGERLTNINHDRDKLFKIERGMYELYQEEKHGVWQIYKFEDEFKIREYTGVLLHDISEIYHNITFDETTKKRFIDARLGQGEYRNNVLKMYPFCPVTGIELPEMVRASHIKPWRLSNDVERLDPYNGITLAAHVDVLFDKGFITFTNDGVMKVAKRKDIIDTMERLKLPTEIKIKVENESLKYLEWHRYNFGFDDE